MAPSSVSFSIDGDRRASEIPRTSVYGNAHGASQKRSMKDFGIASGKPYYHTHRHFSSRGRVPTTTSSALTNCGLIRFTDDTRTHAPNPAVFCGSFFPYFQRQPIFISESQHIIKQLFGSALECRMERAKAAALQPVSCTTEGVLM